MTSLILFDISTQNHMLWYPFVSSCLRHCITTWYAMVRYLVKLTELETSWGRGDTVTY